jgi:asparagine synthase (glutamine-hydrolysing)
MCGIAGAVATRPGAMVSRERLERISCLLAHRGPDAHGTWAAPSGRAALAHRRLSVIDLATGQQPMLSDDGRIGLVFNGEIYNYRELRATLAAQGASFRTQSDTEVLLRLYERKGDACLEDLRGMFAFAIWDDAAGRLLIARDRIGKKPLFYTIDDGCLYFASSLRALRETSRTAWEIDPAAVDAYLTLSYIPAPRTVYRGVSKLEAGTAATLGADGVVTHRYSDFATEPPPVSVPGTFGEAVDRLDEILNTAVAIRLRSDVPLGVFLSGGIDSSLVAAIAAKQSATPITTFSIGFDVSEFDESPYAATVARTLGTDHHVFHAHPDLLHTLPEMVRHYGEPFGDSSALATWMLARETRKHVTVALAGDGGDEGFAGYNWYRTAERLRTLTGIVPSAVFRTAASPLDALLGAVVPGSRVAGQLRRGVRMLGATDDAERAALLRAHVGPAEARRLYAGELREARNGSIGAAVEHFADLYRSCPGTGLRRVRYADATTYLADCLMPKVDVATMAHGLEARAPLLDQDVMRFALALPDAWLLDDSGGKKILKAVLARYLPLSLFDRPKQGFSVPLKTWFVGNTRSVAASVATSERLRDTGWFQTAGLQSLVDEHASGLRDHSQRIFSLLVLDEWLEHG